MGFKRRTIEFYPEIFEKGDGEQSIAGAVESFGAKWGWYQSVFALAGGNIERFKHITKLKATECFLALSFIKEKTELEAKQIKKAHKI